MVDSCQFLLYIGVNLHNQLHIAFIYIFLYFISRGNVRENTDEYNRQRAEQKSEDCHFA
ncbi:hypothetical protein D3C78_1066370 [compost metagenome]